MFAHSNAFLKQTLGGWQVNTIFTISSGQLYAAPSGVQATGVDPHIKDPTSSREFNTCTLTVAQTLQNCAAGERPAFYITPAYTLNGLNPFYGGFRTSVPSNVNLSIFKAFPIKDALNLQFRAESFNLVNTPVLGAPDLSATSPTFGSLTNFAQTNDPRNLQFALRLSF